MNYRIAMRMAALPLLLGASMCCTLQAAEYDPRLQGVIQRNMDAMGGMRVWNQAESIRLIGTIEMKGKVFKLCTIKKRPNLVRVTMSLESDATDGNTVQIIQGFNGKEAWIANRVDGVLVQQVGDLSARDAATLEIESMLNPQIKSFREAGYDLEYLDEGLDEERKIALIRATSEEKPLRFELFVDTSTWLLERMVAYPKDPSASEPISTTTFHEYRNSDGLLVPMVAEIVAGENQRSTVRLESVETGVGIYDEYFAKSGILSEIALDSPELADLAPVTDSE